MVPNPPTASPPDLEAFAFDALLFRVRSTYADLKTPYSTKKALLADWNSQQGGNSSLPGRDIHLSVMPHPNISMRAKPGSNSPASTPQKTVPPSPQFTESQQSNPPQGSSRPGNNLGPPDQLSPGELSLDATESFPTGLFRVPIPNAVFAKMPDVSDSALRCLLALIHLSFRFEPEKSEWVCPDRQFSRSDIEEASGLSDQGARNGLSELESLGWIRIDRGGRSHQHQLLLEVPQSRFTYVPTALLEQASEVGSGTALRVILAVLRRTWGWTSQRSNPPNGQQETVHDRWAQLSNRELANATGRSETAVGQAAQSLQGEWTQRVRPGNGAYQYRFLPEAVGDYPEEESSFSEGNANDLTPDRQKSGTPSFSKESSCRDKHKRQDKNTGDTPSEEPPLSEPDAVPTDNSSQQVTASEESSQTPSPNGEAPPPDFTGLPPEKQDLAEKLSNVGIWAGRIAEVLSRFSTERIRANFQLYRRRTAEQTIRKPGAWLYAAITDEYALPGSSPDESEGSASAAPGSLPPLEHKGTLSEAKKDAYVAQGIDEERFHRCPSGRSGPEERRFMYFDPAVGGPERRV